MPGTRGLHSRGFLQAMGPLALPPPPCSLSDRLRGRKGETSASKKRKSSRGTEGQPRPQPHGLSPTCHVPCVFWIQSPWCPHTASQLGEAGRLLRLSPGEVTPCAVRSCLEPRKAQRAQEFRVFAEGVFIDSSAGECL